MASKDDVYGWNRNGHIESLLEIRFGKIFWVSGIYPNIHGRNLYFFFIMYLLFYVELVWAIAASAITAYLYVPNIILLSESLTYCTLFIITLITSVLCVIRRSSFEKTFMESENHFQYDENIPDLLKCRKIVKKLKASLSIGCATIGIFIFSILFIAPYVEQSWGSKYKIPDSIDVHLAVPIWSPNPNSTIISNLLFLSQMCTGLSSLCIAIGTAVLILHFSIILFTELYTLNWSIKNVNKRAQDHYDLFKFDESFQNQNRSLNDSLVHVCKQNIQHFIKIKKFAALFFDAIDRQLFLIMSTISISIGFSMTAIVYGGDHPGKILNAICILVAQILVISLLCLLGQLILNESERLRYTIYEIDWINYDTKIRRMIMIMQLMFHNPIRMTSGKGVLRVDFRALQGVLNSAYSFFTILRAMQEF